MKKKFFLSCLLIVMALLPAVAQIQDPVQFKTELKTISDTEAQIVFTGKIDAGWHAVSYTHLSWITNHTFHILSSSRY